MFEQVDIELDRIDFAYYNFRSSVDTSDSRIVELSEDIGHHGQIANAIVIPRWSFQDTAFDWTLLVGHMRWLALKAQQDRGGKPRCLSCTIRYPANEAEALSILISENMKRVSFLPSEIAAAEVKLRSHMINLGLVSTKENPVPGMPSYAALRAAEEGVSTRTIEKRVAIGTASLELKEAADTKLISYNGAATLASFEIPVQKEALAILHDFDVSMADSREVSAAVNLVMVRNGKPAIKAGVEYLPGLQTKTLSKRVGAMTPHILAGNLYEALKEAEYGVIDIYDLKAVCDYPTSDWTDEVWALYGCLKKALEIRDD